jgi:hypothetical protein
MQDASQVCLRCRPSLIEIHRCLHGVKHAKVVSLLNDVEMLTRSLILCRGYLFGFLLGYLILIRFVIRSAR